MIDRKFFISDKLYLPYSLVGEAKHVSDIVTECNGVFSDFYFTDAEEYYCGPVALDLQPNFTKNVLAKYTEYGGIYSIVFDAISVYIEYVSVGGMRVPVIEEIRAENKIEICLLSRTGSQYPNAMVMSVTLK